MFHDCFDTGVHGVDPTVFFVFSDFVHIQSFDTRVHGVDPTLFFVLSDIFFHDCFDKGVHRVGPTLFFQCSFAFMSVLAHGFTEYILHCCWL